MQHPSTPLLRDFENFKASCSEQKSYYSELSEKAMRYSKPLLACLALGLGTVFLFGFSSFKGFDEYKGLNSDLKETVNHVDSSSTSLSLLSAEDQYKDKLASLTTE